MSMTKKDALSIASKILTDTLATMEDVADNEADGIEEAINVIDSMVNNLSKPRTVSPEAKEKANAKRKEATAAARAELIAQVAPVLREALSHTLIGVTAKELYDLAKAKLPDDFSPAKVQNVLLREMAPEVVKSETKGKANTYALKERE